MGSAGQGVLGDMVELSLALSETEDSSKLGEVPLELSDRFYFAAHHLLENFVKSTNGKLVLPKNLSTSQKHYLLTVMQCMRLIVRFTRDANAFLLKTSYRVPFARPLVLAGETRKILLTHCKSPLRNLDRLLRERLNTFVFRSVGALTAGNPRVPSAPMNSEFRSRRESLPIYSYRAEILSLIENNPVTVITGRAGCGKSTQIPQYILEEAERTNTPARILVATPINVAVVALCDRVAAERGETVGLTVGYQIPLESNSSPIETLLNFVSIPIIIRAMGMPGCKLLASTTHVIVDELQLRTKYQDFLLRCLMDALNVHQNLKVVLVSEEYNMEDIVEFFSAPQQPPRLSIPHEVHNTRVYHLEDMLQCKWQLQAGGKVYCLNEMTSIKARRSENIKCAMEEAKLNALADSFIENVFKRNDVSSSFTDFWNLVRTDEIPIDYLHSKTSASMLMAVVVAGRLDLTRVLVDAGANLSLRSENGFAALDWALRLNSKEIIEYLQCHKTQKDALTSSQSITLDYIRRYDPKRTDLKLVCHLVQMIHCRDISGGTILVFLKSYEEIMELKELISSGYARDPDGWTDNPLHIYFLHEFIQRGDHVAVFDKPTDGSRKIILSTFLAESCFTLPDTKYVIDCGKSARASKEEGETMIEPVCLSMPNGLWISKAEADQRKWQVSCEHGACYRLYTHQCYESMAEVPKPEILETELLDLSLQSRSLLRNEVRVAQFFAELPTPPPSKAVEDAVQTLILMGAMETDEQLSDLGVHLLDYEIDPRWAKALIYSVIFKCMDPVLTMASCASYGQPFYIPDNPDQRSRSYVEKLLKSCGTQSDHVALLKVFQRWEGERARRADEGEDCGYKIQSESYISPYTFDIAYGIRTRLLAHLRATGFVRTKGQSDVIDTNTYANSLPLVKAVLTAAMYPNLAVTNRVSRVLFDRESSSVQFGKSSVISIENPDWEWGLPSDWIVYDKKVKAPDGTEEINCCSLVNPVTVAMFAGDLYSQPTFDAQVQVPVVHGAGFTYSSQDRNAMMRQIGSCSYSLNIDQWIHMFSFDPSSKELLNIRNQLILVVKRHLRNPECPILEVEDRILDTTVKILTAEDARLGLKQTGIGQWPKLVAGNLLSTSLTGFRVSRENGQH